jgi:hypothetical protein
MTIFDLSTPSLAAEFDCVARLVAGLPVEPLAVTGLGAGGAGFVIVDPSVASPIADELLRSREFVAAARALETL